eukprot:CAMPEP_0170565760 /NCGR_PEP_ID=MMETSP0211-20121228/79390_1 /TAXON_ID=311385 /ORGANISM="Pseudokeronopsis sp., Strain OXSARD2" /LENGTH=121 /DNA_ID=CAMNT_0010886721 /DNA_START=1100 /DNA_END=1466 /DNA_ORIENTATION=-
MARDIEYRKKRIDSITSYRDENGEVLKGTCSDVILKFEKEQEDILKTIPSITLKDLISLTMNAPPNVSDSKEIGVSIQGPLETTAKTSLGFPTDQKWLMIKSTEIKYITLKYPTDVKMEKL